MAIKFKTIQRGRPGVVGGGEKKYYASANVTGEVSIEGLKYRERSRYTRGIICLGRCIGRRNV